MIDKPAYTDNLFRSNAINKLNVVNDLQNPLRIINPGSIIWLCVAALLITSITTWGIFGEISTNIQSSGIILNKNSQVLPMLASHPGNVTEIFVKPGDQIKKNTLMATIKNPFLESDLIYLQQTHTNNKKILTEFRNEYETRSQTLSQQLTQQEVFLKNSIALKRTRLHTLNSILLKKKEIYLKHYLTIVDLEHATEEYNIAKEDLDKTILTLQELPIKLKQLQTELNEKMDKYTANFIDSKHNLEKKIVENRQGSLITSPVDGKIISIHITRGSPIAAGKTLFTVLTDNAEKNLEAIVFINHTDGKKISVGMETYILPNTMTPYEHGYIKGKVVNISEYPASKESVFYYLGNMNLVDEFFKNGVPFIAKIQLLTNTQTKSGLSWTTKKGAPYPINPGSTISAKIINKKAAPIQFLIHGELNV